MQPQPSHFPWGGVLSAHADETYSGEIQVTAAVESSYTLIIPSAISLTNAENGKTGSGTYKNTFDVTVKGDIGENQKVIVSVVPPTQQYAGLAGVATSFEGTPKTEWNREDVAGEGTAAPYTLKAESLTPGTWTGTATYNCIIKTMISFSKHNGAGGATYQAEYGMTWREFIESEYNTENWKIIEFASDGSFGFPEGVFEGVVLDWSEYDDGMCFVHYEGRQLVNPDDSIIPGSVYDVTAYLVM